MGSVRPHDGAPPRRDKANPTVADPVGVGRGSASKRKPKGAAGDPYAPWDARPDRSSDPNAPGLALLLTGSSLTRAVAAALLLTMAAAPFLKGILAGFALAGAAAAIRDVLGA